jgi:hypothetical protein
MGKSVIKNLAWASLAAAACGNALASEDYDLRYAPGIGGADMSAPFEAGWVFQAPVYLYSGSVKNSIPQVTDLNAPPFLLGMPGSPTATTVVDTKTQISVQALLPRLSFMTSTTLFGATVGGTAMVPLVNKRSGAVVKGINTTLDAPGLPPAIGQGITSAIDSVATRQANGLAAANSNNSYGIGDLELSPILRWSTDNSQLLLITTLVTPTGGYDDRKAANPSAGDFYTFRPALQYSYIGDGWDLGSRVAYSWNTRNQQTHYRTGQYFNMDAVLMKSLSDSMRVGAAGYAMVQTTADNADRPPEDQAMAARWAGTLGQKGHVFGLGPEFAYIKGAGEYLLDGRIMKEFGAEDRPEGWTAVVTLSKPF